jgi:hypothetical protein
VNRGATESGDLRKRPDTPPAATRRRRLQRCPDARDRINTYRWLASPTWRISPEALRPVMLKPAPPHHHRARADVQASSGRTRRQSLGRKQDDTGPSCDALRRPPAPNPQDEDPSIRVTQRHRRTRTNLGHEPWFGTLQDAAGNCGTHLIPIAAVNRCGVPGHYQGDFCHDADDLQTLRGICTYPDSHTTERRLFKKGVKKSGARVMPDRERGRFFSSGGCRTAYSSSSATGLRTTSPAYCWMIERRPVYRNPIWKRTRNGSVP